MDYFAPADMPKSFLQEETRIGHVVSATMKRVWATQIDLLKRFEAVCDKFHLRYSLFGGSMLGAIRHRGFIPWDDDIDVIMPRRDYDTLVSHPEEFEDPYFLQTARTDDGCFGNCIKLRNIRTQGTIWFDKYARFKQGIWIDIFVLDDVPLNRLERFIKLAKIKVVGGILYGLYWANAGFQLALHRPVRCPFLGLGLYDKYESICRKSASGGVKGTTTLLFYEELAMNFFPNGSFDNLRTVPFEWTDAKMVDDQTARFVLKNQYGVDWMTPKHAPSEHGSADFGA